MNLIGLDAFRTAVRAGGKPESGVFRVSVAKPKAVVGKERAFRFCFSDASVDRMGDTIDAAGWDLHAFNANPVALWAHDSSQPPVGRASNVLVEDQRLMGDIEFAAPEVYAFADTIYRLVAAKFINAVSVGFLPREYAWADDDDREWGIDFKRQELLEISIVPVPANAHALINARAKGIDLQPLTDWAERILDGGGKVIVPKSQIEKLRKAAKESSMARTPRKRVKADGASETDPDAGGAAVGNCGRPVDNECGMKDPAECSIHGFGGAGAGGEGDEDKHMDLNAMRKAIRQEMAVALKTLRKDAEDNDDPSSAEAPDEPLQKAFGHMKAAEVFHKMAMASHKKALDILSDVTSDDKAEDDDDSPERPSDDGADEERAALIAEIKRLRG